MKKNKMMRLASVLMVAVMLTTSVISGTYAKYVTTTSTNDSARVAHWGVELATNIDGLFANEYSSHTSFAGATVNGLNAQAAADVVAPGTSGSMTFSITGTPEVAVNVAITLNNKANDEADDTLSMITLPAKTGYTDYTVWPNGTFNVQNNYYPIQWTLKRADTSTGDKAVVNYTVNEVTTPLTGVNLQTIQNYLTSISHDYGVNTELNETFGYYELSWTWTFAGHEKEDTYLGQVISGKATDTSVTTTEAFDMKITVTQID